MFGNTKTTQLDTVIGTEMCIRGDVEFSGGLHVDGKIFGDVQVTDSNAESRMVVARSARIEGNLKVGDIDINGTVQGNIFSDGKVELLSDARVTGRIQYCTLRMDQGAEFNGELICKDSSRRDDKVPAISSSGEPSLALNIDASD